MYWPDSGKGCHFFPLHIPHKQLLRVICSLINLSIKLFRQAAVCYTLSILGFVNKENGCDLTWKCPVGNNPVLSERGKADLFGLFIFNSYDSFHKVWRGFVGPLTLSYPSFSSEKGEQETWTWWEFEMECQAKTMTMQCHWLHLVSWSFWSPF